VTISRLIQSGRLHGFSTDEACLGVCIGSLCNFQ
jgi:hypothetical protein